MLRVRLSRSEIILLIEIFGKKGKLDIVDNIVVGFSDDILDEIIETIGDYLIKKGFDRKLNLTTKGQQIESLQDKFLSKIQN